jgi:hypothetical protein
MVDMFKDYISLKTENDSQVMDALKEIENILGDPDASHIRISFLMELSAMSHQISGLSITLIPDPLSNNQHKKCIEKGLIKAVSDGDVSAEQVFKLAHSVEGLENFSNMLFEIPKSRHASCWAKAMETSFPIPQVNFREVVNIDPKESIILNIASEWISLLQILFPPRRKLALGFRDAAKTRKVKPSSLESPIPRRSPFINALLNMPNLIEFISNDEIKNLMMRFPWELVRETARSADTLRAFLISVNESLESVYSREELEILAIYFSSEQNQTDRFAGEYKIIALLIKSTDLSN